MRCPGVTAPSVASATAPVSPSLSQLPSQSITLLLAAMSRSPLPSPGLCQLSGPHSVARGGTALITQRNCLSLEGIQRKAHVIAGYPDVQGLWEGGWAMEPVQKMCFTGSWGVQLPAWHPGAGCGFLCVPTGLRGPNSTSWSMTE